MKILGIETSCDETAAAVVEDGRRILSSVVATPIKDHQPYAGVVPELASRAHVLKVNSVVSKAIEKSHSRPDAIAVTVGPGLAGALLVGRMTAEALGWVRRIPVYGVNHIEGHLLSPLLAEPDLRPPFLGLVVSGGHTELVYADRGGGYWLIGRTRDDAAGEAFDKVARMLGLGYPGGPIIDQMAQEGNANRYPFPRPWLPGTWDFSFSGLKTAMLYKLRERKKWSLQQKKDLCAGFQSAVIDVISTKALMAVRAFHLKTLIVGGGVAANSQLRSALAEGARLAGLKLSVAPPNLCTDNAAMIAACAYLKIRHGKSSQMKDLRIQPQLHIPKYRQSLPSFHR